MTLEEIKLRQLTNQYLVAPGEKLTVVRDLCGVQAQFMKNALHALRIRCSDFSQETVADGLVKNWTIRGTVHVFAEKDLSLFLHESNKPHRPKDTLGADECISAQRKQFFADLILNKVGSGITERQELKEVCFAAGMTEREAESVFDPWGGTIRALCESGKLCHQVGAKKCFQIAPDFTPMEQQAAEVEMARRYFLHYGPATIKDAAYYFGTTQTIVREWLKKLPVEQFFCEGKTFFYIDSGMHYEKTPPECIFLAGFDPLMLGYQKQESLYLPQEHLRGIFNLAGIVMPAVLLRGRVVGRWKQQKKKLEVTLFEEISKADQNLLEETANGLWSGIQTKFIIN